MAEYLLTGINSEEHAIAESAAKTSIVYPFFIAPPKI
jgi:hypothetical protein